MSSRAWIHGALFVAWFWLSVAGVFSLPAAWLPAWTIASALALGVLITFEQED